MRVYNKVPNMIQPKTVKRILKVTTQEQCCFLFCPASSPFLYKQKQAFQCKSDSELNNKWSNNVNGRVRDW